MDCWVLLKAEMRNCCAIESFDGSTNQPGIASRGTRGGQPRSCAVVNLELRQPDRIVTTPRDELRNVGQVAVVLVRSGRRM